jgi:hypothetical protein
MPEPRCVPLPDRGILRLSGKDARSFLQGLISNDVDRLAPDRALHAALLTPQGKYLFDFMLHERKGGEILLDAERDRLLALVQRLTMYRLRADVTIADASGELAVLAVLGEEAPAAFGLPAAPGAARLVGDAAAAVVAVAVDPRAAALGVRVVLPRDAVPRFRAEHGLAEGELADWDRLRLEQGVPDGSRDLVVERSLLLESGFEELGGVSFTKGCFVGQELTARTKHRGLVKKRLVPVRIHGPLPAVGTVVRRGEREAGEMRSSVPGANGTDGIGLALLRLEQLTPMAAASGPLRAGEATLTPAPPLWLELTAQD